MALLLGMFINRRNMRNILTLLLAFLFAFNAGAAFTPSGIPQWSWGGITLPESMVSETSATNYFMVSASNSGGTTTNYFFQFYKDGVAYQVTTGKSAYCIALGVTAQTSAVTIALMYGDNGFGNNVPVGSVVNPVYEGPPSSPVHMATTSNLEVVAPILFKFPALKYPGVQVQGTAVFYARMLCKEV